MAIQTVFRRYEIKYLLDPAQKAAVMAALTGRMALDAYGRTTIRNLYLDTDTDQLIRRSIEKPIYKEKLRLRSYRQAEAGEPIFVELKKKYKKVVYKRRLMLPEGEALDWICGGEPRQVQGQIEAEIDYFRRFYGGLAPRVFLSYEREAYAPLAGADLPDGFRVTFDENILGRRDGLSLGLPPGGEPLLGDGQTLMEIKTGGGIPLWLVDVMSREGIYKVSFSKYGTYYQRHILHQDEIGRVSLC